MWGMYTFSVTSAKDGTTYHFPLQNLVAVVTDGANVED